MNFKPLFDLRLEHSYYKNRQCPDFQIIPDEITEQQLRNHRAILKTRVDGVKLIQAVDNTGAPLIPLQEGMVFRFQLKLKNMDFMLFTDLNDLSASELPLYSNEGLNELGNIKLHRNLIAKLKSIDYFALVDIHVNNTLSVASNIMRQFVINFTARKVRWLYYFVTNLKHAENIEFQIKDTNVGSDSVLINFQQNIAESGVDKVSDGLVGQYPNMQHMKFISEQSISCRQATKKNIQLFLGTEKLLENLPNPPLNNFSRLIEKKGDDLETQDFQFQVIKYISQPFTINGT